jgi:hypothetical protein
LTTREKAEYNASAMRSYSYIKGMGNKIKDSLSSTISEEEMKIAVAEREREVETAIKEELSEGVLKRKSVQSIVSALGHRLDEWNRDWGRIVATEMENIFQIGTAQMIMKEHGIHAKVYKQTMPQACRYCINAYTTNGIGSKPVIFDLSELIANGTNIGRKSKDWKPVLTNIHPFCRCLLRYVPDGYEWDDKTQSFEPKKVEDKDRVQRKSKVKITVGTKYFEV